MLMLMLMLTTDNNEVEWSGGTAAQAVLVSDVHYWVVFISAESVDVH